LLLAHQNGFEADKKAVLVAILHLLQRFDGWKTDPLG
jgi:hypothetical protein